MAQMTTAGGGSGVRLAKNAGTLASRLTHETSPDNWGVIDRNSAHNEAADMLIFQRSSERCLSNEWVEWSGALTWCKSQGIRRRWHTP
jgi:hypothetical protein